MKRKKTPGDIETAVLVKSVRRCTLCFHLSGDLSEKHGQIAHIDGNPANFAEDNLAWMCLVHHTLYDSKNSQHKNYTMREVKTTRARLYEAILQNRHVAAPPTTTIPNGNILTDQRFFDQRRQLVDTAVMKKIWSKARWQISICPTEFLEARLRDLPHCTQFIQTSAVRSLRIPDCPTVKPADIEKDTGGEWIAGELDQPPEPSFANLERWVLFRSGQFVYHRALVDHPKIGNSLHHLEVIWLVTQIFQLAGRMAREGVLSPEGVIRIQLHDVAGRELLVPDFIGSHWSREKQISVERTVTPADLEKREGRDLSLGVAVEIYQRFGWNDPPMGKLSEEQGHL